MDSARRATLDVPSPAALRARAAILRAIRAWLHDQGFVEIDAPVQVRSPAMEPYLEALPAGEGWLHTSPEFSLKRVLAAGLPRIFAITPCFRAEEIGPHHATEFTMLEWYRAGADYRGIMDDLEAILAAAASAVGREAPPVERTTFRAALARYSPGPLPDDADELTRRWINDVELKLRAPTIVADYPADQAAFAEIRGDVCERFELYWEGVELANAFTELLDPAELDARWRDANADRVARGRAPYPIDERLLAAVGSHPRCGGIAVGIDRLVMVLLGREDIREVRVGG